MRNGYFPNRENMCVGTALANALLALGDGTVAQRVFLNYRRHPLVWQSGGGNHMGVTARILHDLTDSIYNGKFYGALQGIAEERRGVLLKHFEGVQSSDQLELVLRTIEEDIAAGVIHFLDAGEQFSLPLFPCVVFTDASREYIVDADSVIQGSRKIDDRTKGHAIALLDGGCTIVDNGYPMHTRCDYDLKALRVTGALTITQH